ncbi:MAG: lasso peptide biosynthesis B2 protein [Candidatus Acidiferrales bacterium]
MKTWYRFWSLTVFERIALLEAAGALIATYAGLRVTGFRRWRAAVERFTRGPSVESSFDASAKAKIGEDLARMESAAARYLPFRTNCLEQSLVLWWLLRRHGLAAGLKIGARKEAGRFEAHAWVEFEGGMISDMSEEHLHFVPFEGSATAMETQAQ